MKELQRLVIEALENEGYEVFDERFIMTDEEDCNLPVGLTIAFDKNIKDAKEIKIAEGDYIQYYSNYDFVLFVGCNSDLDEIFEELRG